MLPGRIAVVALSATMAVVTAIGLAPSSLADPTADLRAAVAAKRGGCAALKPDPVLDGVAQRADIETQSYAGHTARYMPMEDPMPMLHQLSYPAGKAKLFTGFADATRFEDFQEKASYGAVLFASETIPDCSYNRYGADVLIDANAGRALAAIVLAGD